MPRRTSFTSEAAHRLVPAARQDRRRNDVIKVTSGTILCETGAQEEWVTRQGDFLPGCGRLPSRDRADTSPLRAGPSTGQTAREEDGDGHSRTCSVLEQLRDLDAGGPKGGRRPRPGGGCSTTSSGPDLLERWSPGEEEERDPWVRAVADCSPRQPRPDRWARKPRKPGLRLEDQIVRRCGAARCGADLVPSAR